MIHSHRSGVLGHDVHGPDSHSQDVHSQNGAPVVVLGSSIGSTRSMWDEQLPLLARHFRVVRYDHRGHGDSPVPPGPYTIDDLGGDLIRLLDRLGVDRAHHVGLSLGGMVAMWLAAHHPDRVDRLVLVCTGAHLPPPSRWRERAATVRARGTAAIADTSVERWFTPAFRATPRAQDVRRGLLDVPDEGYAGCCEAIAGADLRPDLAAIKAPTLVIAGADDPATPPSYAEDLIAGMPPGVASPVRIVDGAAHLGSVEQPEIIGALILEHLAEDRPATEVPSR